MRRGLIMAVSDRGRMSWRARSYHAAGATHHSPHCRQTLDSPSTVPCQACGIWRNVAPKIPSVRRRIVMAGFKLATYQSADGPRAGLIVDDTLFDAAKLTRKAGYTTVIAILEDWKNAQALLKKA